jgi:hypothetical protein
MPGASVHSNLGNGQLGLLQLTVLAAIYNTLSATPFIAPVNPCNNANIPAGSTGPIITKMNHTHDAAVSLFTQYDATDKALKQQIVGALQAMFQRSLWSKYVGYQNSSTHAILDHLYATYTNISTSDLLTNNDQIRTDYDINQPIELFFNQVKDAVNFAAAGNSSYTSVHITTITYQLIFQDSHVPRRMQALETRDNNHQKLNHFLPLPTRNSASCNSRWPAQVSSQQTPPQTTIANPAAATAADRTSVAALTATISKLTIKLSTANACSLPSKTNQQEQPQPSNATTTPTPPGLMTATHTAAKCGI